jgi:hypothetical protein
MLQDGKSIEHHTKIGNQTMAHRDNEITKKKQPKEKPIIYMKPTYLDLSR